MHVNDLSAKKQKLMKKMSVLTGQIQLCDSIPALSAVESHVIAACNAAKIMNETTNQPFNAKTSIPANKKIIPQKPFYSTKMKPNKPKVRLGKPTQKEKEKICNLLHQKSLYSKPATVAGMITEENKSK